VCIPERAAQRLAIEAGQPGQELLVDADGQRQAVTEDREGLLQFFQQLPGVADAMDRDRGKVGSW
jgi:hypothetical protein